MEDVMGGCSRRKALSYVERMVLKSRSICLISLPTPFPVIAATSPACQSVFRLART
ncbi:hypothetical protein NEOLEDRAFT_1136673 [Neolentinus lepideus HHB14362 ss-1]|uniref:Uncharacterized protein n=1 Tax=Neolentinus lepideus HHB14362 ss-1 TaxID=1314782 RepID=A0A165R581_9AGAM|nr:hypothetical protein NEOLEDRAFT_1136673 [Neolentinus lepideus HHB14362 ss-1]